MKKVFLLFMSIVLMFSSTIDAFAYKHPSKFWQINPLYASAVENSDYRNIILYGNQIIDMMKNEPDCYEKESTLTSRYREVGFAYENIGDYENSLITFAQLYDYLEKIGDEYFELKEAARSRIIQYTPEIKMYTDGGTSPYYGTKNEKQNGVLFGVCSDGETRKKLSNESIVLVYQELGYNLSNYCSGVVRNASNDGYAVEFALNCPNQGADIRNINKFASYLREISELFNKYDDVPIYLRFGAEFNLWGDKPTPEEYIVAFRYVSNYFKSRNSNVAIVWSPSHTSDLGIDMHDYYPGDEYVDWVGVSLYTDKYFRGERNQTQHLEVTYKSGKNSNPVVMMKELVERYGDRKPIMLSESGVSHYINTVGEDATSFALQRLREMYLYLPMVYPQIKIIAYFDWMVSADKNDYRLSKNSTLQNEYLRLTKSERFIQDSYNNSTDFCYRELTDGQNVESIFSVSTYAHIYDKAIKKVTYTIDDKYVGESYEMPFTVMVDASKYSGRRTLKATAVTTSGESLVTFSTINISSPDDYEIKVEISDKKIQFDQEPIIINNRTMVPMRKIFEELGADVTWDGNTKTATGRKGDRTIKITVGQKTMYVNNKAIELDVAPVILSSRTLVPARAVAEGLGCDVDWDGKKRLVSITPKVFKWSEWDEDLPSHIDEDLYYIEEETMYSYREKEEYTTDDYHGSSRLVDADEYYGSWSGWQDNRITSNDNRQVETRVVSSPKRYFYAHYCTGNTADSSIRYRTNAEKYSDQCLYHELGWFDEPLPCSEDSYSDYAYYVDGVKYRCSNTCFRWYLIKTEGGDYTQYRSRDIYYEYTYWRWSDWSDYSFKDPYRNHYRNDIDVREKTVYRYKEK